MTEKSAVYGESGYAAHPFDPKQITNMSVVVIEPDDPSNCNDGTGDGMGRGTIRQDGKADYSGCTLADVDADIDSNDAFKPVVNAIFNADGYPAAAQANATLGQRGGSSRLATLKSYKIKLNKGEPKWRGQRTIQLNKEPNDLTRVLNKLAFDLFRTVPDFPSLRTAFVRMDLTDGEGGAKKDYGLFTQLEKLDDDWASAHGFDKNADIIKANNFTFLPLGANADCSDAIQPSPVGTKFCLDYPVGSLQFERAIESEGKDGTPDMGIFKSMLAAVNDNSPYLLVYYENSFGPVMQQYFHADNFATWLATEILTDNHDSVNNNYYLYRPSVMDNYYFLPWDYDKGFDQVHQGNGAQRKITDTTSWAEDPVRHGLGHWWESPLVRRFIQDGGAQVLSNKVDALYQGALSPANVARMLDSYPLCDSQQPVTGAGALCPAAVVNPEATNFIQPMLLRSPDLNDMNSVPSTRGAANPDASLVKTEWEEEIKFLPSAVEQSYQLYKENLNRPMPMFLGAGATSIPGQVKLTWDPSYSVDGRQISYDVSLSKSPVLSDTVMDQGCTKLTDSQPIPEFDPANLVDSNSSDQAGFPIASPEDENEWAWRVTLSASGDYYFRVIARDSEGYCQIPFSHVKFGGTNYYGVRGFHYDLATHEVSRIIP